MNDKWEIGDLALCIKVGPWVRRTPDKGVIGLSNIKGPRTGEVVQVTRMSQPLGKCGLGLFFDKDYPACPSRGWSSRRFVKVSPDAIDEEAKDEHIRPVPVPS